MLSYCVNHLVKESVVAAYNDSSWLYYNIDGEKIDEANVIL